jgi:hypothetical protein
MANVDRPTGFTPVRYLDGSPYMGAASLYFSDSDNLFMGDLVIQDTAGTTYTKSNGVYGTVNRAQAVTDLIVGVVVGWYPDPDNLGRLHHASSTSIPLLVAHIDNLVLECQSDDATMTQSDVGLNADFTFTAGTTATGASNMELDGSTANTTAGLAFRILQMVDRTDGDNSDSVANQRFLVKCNQSAWADQIAGV